MLGTYVSLAALLACGGIYGQALLRICGRREWSWLSPAIGLGLVGAVAWAAVRLPGQGLTGAAIVGVIALAGLAVLVPDGRRIWRALGPGVAVLLVATAAGSLPFLVEGRFGILGTSLNPDMSQHLFAAAQLVDDGTERLIESGYPLGPHSAVVAIAAIYPTLVEGFNGLTLAILVASCLAPLELLGAGSGSRQIAERPALGPFRRTLGCVLIGGSYMSVSYLIQGAFKETMLAMLVLAFAIALHEQSAGRLGGFAPARRWRRLGLVPLSAIAIGAVYCYSFAGLLWIGGAFAIWALVELVVAWRSPGRAFAQRMVGTRGLAKRMLRALGPAVAIALAVFLVAAGPEAGRMADFASFETFNPAGAGLGNLFDAISPAEALGIWPSGDFRLDPGEGVVPAPVYWLCVIVGALALGFGLRWWLRRRERAVPCALAAATALYLYALVAGTPYQGAKAITIAAPLVMLISARALLEAAPLRRTPRQLWPRGGAWVAALAICFLAGAAGSSLLALVNGPVGPARWSKALTVFGSSPDVPTLALVPADLLDDEHGFDLVAWELRGGEVCIEPEGLAEPLPGITRVITVGSQSPPFPGAEREEALGRDALWFVPGHPGTTECPFYADGQRADPSG